MKHVYMHVCCVRPREVYMHACACVREDHLIQKDDACMCVREEHLIQKSSHFVAWEVQGCF